MPTTTVCIYCIYPHRDGQVELAYSVDLTRQKTPTLCWLWKLEVP